MPALWRSHLSPERRRFVRRVQFMVLSAFVSGCYLTSAGVVLLEMAPVALMPYSVLTFLDMVRVALRNKTCAHICSRRVYRGEGYGNEKFPDSVNIGGKERRVYVFDSLRSAGLLGGGGVLFFTPCVRHGR